MGRYSIIASLVTLQAAYKLCMGLIAGLNVSLPFKLHMQASSQNLSAGFFWFTAFEHSSPFINQFVAGSYR
jgi:hypothetical protein